MKVISPFGPKIAKLKFSNQLIKKNNNEVDQILNKKSLLKKLDYSKKLVGQVKQEFQLPKSFVKKNLEKVILKEVKKYIYQTIGKKVKKISIKNFWIVRQFNNEYNPIHYHDGHISGVGYLKIPKFVSKSNYRDRNFYDDLSLENEIKNCGKSGDSLILNTPQCIHRAGIPKFGKHRDVLFVNFVAVPEKIDDIFHFEKDFEDDVWGVAKIGLSKKFSKPKSLKETIKLYKSFKENLKT